MSTISAALVKELRERTGAGMMDCKKFLVKAEGDIERAIEDMRIAGEATAVKKAGRIAADGNIACERSNDCKMAVMVETNSETDFVARDANFVEFTKKVAKTALQSQDMKDMEALGNAILVGTSDTVEKARQDLVNKIGENIKLRRMVRVQSESAVGVYLHGQKIGVLVALKNGDENLAKDIAMHIAASRPMVISRNEVPKDAIENERNIFTAQAKESGKPQDIIDKMVEGRISKFMEEVSLLDQAFVKDPQKKIAQLLKEHNAEVTAFYRFEVGEGIEKKEDNFVEEVMAQVRG